MNTGIEMYLQESAKDVPKKVVVLSFTGVILDPIAVFYYPQDPSDRLHWTSPACLRMQPLVSDKEFKK